MAGIKHNHSSLSINFSLLAVAMTRVNGRFSLADKATEKRFDWLNDKKVRIGHTSLKQVRVFGVGGETKNRKSVPTLENKKEDNRNRNRETIKFLIIKNWLLD
jgi:hypothetical protein